MSTIYTTDAVQPDPEERASTGPRIHDAPEDGTEDHAEPDHDDSELDDHDDDHEADHDEAAGDHAEVSARPSVRTLTARVARFRERRDRIRDENDTLRAQIAILDGELRSPAERQATGAGTPADREYDPGRASFQLSGQMHRRHSAAGVNAQAHLKEPIFALSNKTVGRQFAQAHGVRVPQVLGRWAHPDEIDWSTLPQRFVVKSTIGGGGINVFPLERRGESYFDFITSTEITSAEVVEKLVKRHRQGSAYFAEEMLVQRGGSGLPNDIKVFCFYGEVGYIEVRAEDWSRSTDTVQRMRTFLPDGTEVRNARALLPRDGTIATPQDFPGVVAAARRLSGAIRRPFERIDFYETDDGIVFGEITQNPGRPPILAPPWDQRMGELYEDGAARLFADLAREGHLQVEFGDQGRG